MEDQLFKREEKIENYTTGTTAENLQALQDMESAGLGNASLYRSGQNIEQQHTDGMKQYTNQFARNSYANVYGDDEDNAEFINFAMNHMDDATLQAARIEATTRQEQYYFRRSERSFAKAERYRRLSQNEDALKAHANAHGNRSASKRAKKARSASKAYKKVARLQTAYERNLERLHRVERSQDDAMGGGRIRAEHQRGTWRAMDLADYTRLEEITRARIEAMTLAAQAKSISKQQENYSIQKGTLKNLLVLRDSLNQLLQEKGGTDEEAPLREKQTALNEEIAMTREKVDQFVPQGANS